MSPRLVILSCLAVGCGETANERAPAVPAPVNSTGKSIPIELKPPEWGTLEGTVSYDGEPPVPINRRREIMSTMEQHCLKGPEDELLDPTWKVNKKNKGVANVVVFLRPPPGKQFYVAEEDRVRKDIVTLDVPFCAFRPHVFVLFPTYYHEGMSKQTGQRFKIRNSSIDGQNRRWTGDPMANPSGGEYFPAGKEIFLELKPQQKPVEFALDWARWMRAYGWVLPHPYAAVSDVEGRFRIPRLPAGIDVYLFAWHEAKGTFFGGNEGTKRVFHSGANTLTLKVAE